MKTQTEEAHQGKCCQRLGALLQRRGGVHPGARERLARRHVTRRAQRGAQRRRRRRSSRRSAVILIILVADAVR